MSTREAPKGGLPRRPADISPEIQRENFREKVIEIIRKYDEYIKLLQNDDFIEADLELQNAWPKSGNIEEARLEQTIIINELTNKLLQLFIKYGLPDLANQIHSLFSDIKNQEAYKNHTREHGDKIILGGEAKLIPVFGHRVEINLLISDIKLAIQELNNILNS